ncbi:GNAT family N-acetyltransferase [Clavibacter lycopersici]|uniref:GNAT family N-acetyltransferase n=1 Tax=Clavibacter lycopersici TaxID=2301718 RepID=UPI0028806FEA|nr:GNAT family N-acetyltransferase [Clavibacter lycopersici]
MTAAAAEDVEALHAFLAAADLTVSGLDDPGVRLWIRRDADGRVTASTGFELSADGRHALIRSVAVAAELRSAGLGSELARHALAEAAAAGAERAWLFSRRSGPFWRGLGFAEADRDALAPRCPTPARSSHSARAGSWRARSRGPGRWGPSRMSRPRLAG